MIKKSIWGKIIKEFSVEEIKIIKRNIKWEIPKIQRALTIIGPRRAGKTFFMFQILKELKEKNAIYLNLEDPRLIGCKLKDLLNFLEVYYELYPERSREINYFFLDEVQNVKNWEKFVRFLLDKNQKVVISGSSSKLLSKEIATELRGRAITVKVYPFSFKEIAKAKNLPVEKYLSTYEESIIKKNAKEYLEWGGYPEVVLNPSLRREILKEILDLTIYKDIVERWGIRNIKILKLLIKSLATSTHLTVSKIYNNLKGLGYDIGKTTISNYLHYLEDSFIVYTLLPYEKSYKKQEMLGFKPYFIDNGILNIIGCSESKMLENIVLVELLKNGYQEIYYYITRKNKEIDFFVKEKNTLIETTYEAEKEHIKKVKDAMGELGVKKGYIITWDEETVVKEKGKEIKIVPLWKWMLGFS